VDSNIKNRVGKLKSTPEILVKSQKSRLFISYKRRGFSVKMMPLSVLSFLKQTQIVSVKRKPNENTFFILPFKTGKRSKAGRDAKLHRERIQIHF
jgi:hypothetical protein